MVRPTPPRAGGRPCCDARERGGITTAEAAELLGVKDYTARRILNAMADDGFLEKTWGRRGRVYKPAQGSY